MEWYIFPPHSHNKRPREYHIRNHSEDGKCSIVHKFICYPSFQPSNRKLRTTSARWNLKQCLSISPSILDYLFRWALFSIASSMLWDLILFWTLLQMFHDFQNTQVDVHDTSLWNSHRVRCCVHIIGGEHFMWLLCRGLIVAYLRVYRHKDIWPCREYKIPPRARKLTWLEWREIKSWVAW